MGPDVGQSTPALPVYNTDGSLSCRFNRVQAFHAGLAGDPCPDVHWRALFTHVRTLGTYDAPTPTPRHATYFMAEVGYTPHQMPGWGATLSIGTNAGQLIGTSQGLMLTVTKTGVFNRRTVE